MAILGPALSQCRSFVVDVKYSTSLPFLSRYLRGSAEHLRILKLQCDVDDAEDVELPSIPEQHAVKFPLLSIAVFDGVTFLDACHIESFTEQFKSLSLSTLSISNLSVPEDEEVDLYTLCGHCQFGFIRHLILRNINAGYDPGTIDSGQYEPKVNCVTLIGHDLVFTEEFLLATYGSTFCYWHVGGSGLSECSVPRPTTSDWRT